MDRNKDRNRLFPEEEPRNNDLKINSSIPFYTAGGSMS